MAGRALAFPGADVWEQFRCLAEHHVGEGNIEAGERLWEIVPSSGAAAVFTIRSTRWNADAIVCALDFATGELTCATGPAIPAPPLSFQVLPDTPGIVRRGGIDFTIDAAVNLVLDELVWVDQV